MAGVFCLAAPLAGTLLSALPARMMQRSAAQVGAVIPGWREGVALMPVGAKYRFWIPGELAYGKRGSPPMIGPNQPLVFDVELMDILK